MPILEQLADSVRRVAPHAAILFIGWPVSSHFDRRHQKTHSMQIYERLQAALRRSAESHRFDVLFVHTVLVGLVHLGHSVRKFYGDAVHPSGSGHELLGEAVARLIVTR